MNYFRIKVSDFDLKHTLECGQLFRWDFWDGWYYLVLRKRVLKLRQEGNELVFCGKSEGSREELEGFVRHYFRIGEDYAQIVREISRDDIIRKAIEKYPRLRLVRQDPWECLMSYVCSSVTKIPMIKRNLNELSRQFGERIEFDGRVFYGFPDIGKIDDMSKIGCCGVGFRQDYLFKINDILSKDRTFLEGLKAMSYEDAKSELLKLPGVGSKIADCVLLFSLGFDSAFPIDTWIRRFMLENYSSLFVKSESSGKNDKLNEKTDEKDKKSSKIASDKLISEFARSYFGRYAGYAQEFLFYYRRLL